MVDVEELRERFLNMEFDTKEFQFDAQDAADAARFAGETLSEFTDPSHENFEVSCAFLASFASGRRLPIDFPSLGGISMDGGKAVTSHAPVRANAKLTGRTHLHEIYDKSGRSGRMIFLVARTELKDDNDVHYATLDARQVIREKPSA
jgi:hypothetical protein